MNTPNTADDDILRTAGLSVIEIEQAALADLATRIDDTFITACRYCLGCQGRVIVSGMGKSGHIARKIAATLASTGTPAFFVHPGEASHGDMGMITQQDVLLVLSNSGRTDELLALLPLIKRLKIPLIAMTGSPHSVLATTATVHIDVSITKEACPLGLAPTASTTATLAMGDALAIALLKARNFTANDFALSHPSGTLGRRLLLHVSDLMVTGDAIPQVVSGTALTVALVEMTEKRLGMTIVVDKQYNVIGLYTDGDLRRTIESVSDLHTVTIDEVMTSEFKCVTPAILAVDALSKMQQNKITSLVVLDDSNKLCGVLHMHTLLQAGVV